MNSNIEIFNYNAHEVRTVNKDGEIWFVAKDVCDVLELTNPTVAIDALDDDERAKFFLGRQGEANIINEAGLYALIFRSNKPEAKQFSRWVRHELLPQVLRTGNYSAYKENYSVPSGVLEGAKFILNDAGITGNQCTLALDKVYKSYTGQSLLLTAGIELESPVKEQALTATQIAEILGIGKGNKGAQIVNNLLLNAVYQRRVGKLWEPTEKGKPYAIMVDTNKKHTDGTSVRQLKWNSGILDVVKKLAREMSANLAKAV